jgi:hypothetical protein
VHCGIRVKASEQALTDSHAAAQCGHGKHACQSDPMDDDAIINDAGKHNVNEMNEMELIGLNDTAGGGHCHGRAAKRRGNR